MTDAEIIANLMFQVRVNECAICKLATKAGLNPDELLNDATEIVEQMLREDKFNAPS